ncbi:SCO family protein [Bacillaceae bacterium Marseille-Q3522]|nr:SCO family protein [Bacillaceae bacterium Marseille-Q3522]
MKKLMMLVCCAVIVLFIPGSGLAGIKNALDWPIEEDFSFTNQSGKSFGMSDLKGKVWLAAFIFTNCDDVCLPMTANMKKIQLLAQEENLDLQLVAFSVDPEMDKPEVLMEFANKFGVDFANWNFLTGYKQVYIEQFAAMVFHTLVKKPASDDQVIHGTEIFLVDQNGVIKQSYSGLADIPLEQIISDIKTLQ